MTQFLLGIGTFWLLAAIWVAAGGSQDVVWASMLPAAWLVSLPLLKG